MANINFFYSQYVTTFMTIDMNENGLYCEVPSESNGESYTVQVDESGVCPSSTSCTCQGFKYRKSCKHCTIVNAFYAKLYASNIVKAEQKALEQAMDDADEQEEAYELAEIVDAIFTGVAVATPVKIAPKVRKQGNKLVKTPVLNGQPQKDEMPSWLAILPSRQKKPAA